MPRPAFPASRLEFNRRFASEEACFDFLIESRWPVARTCPKCRNDKWYRRTEALALECSKCSRVVTATSGTVMHRSRQPLSSWLLAAWALVTDKRGVSATYLANELGVRLETAWNMLHKLRAAMVDPDRSVLRGLVEADETLVGGTRRGAGKGTWKGAQAIVLGAVEVRGKRTPGRIRLWQMPEGRAALAIRFLKANVDPDGTIRTDGGYLYKGLLDAGFNHDIVSVAHGDKQEDVLPALHLAFSNLKSWLQGTLHGAVRKEHLQAYLNEFAFRFNRRRNLHAAFQTILGIAARVRGPTYEGLYKGTFVHPNPAGERAQD